VHSFSSALVRDVVFFGKNCGKYFVSKFCTRIPWTTTATAPSGSRKLVLYSLFWMRYSHLMTKRFVTAVDEHTIQCLWRVLKSVFWDKFWLFLNLGKNKQNFGNDLDFIFCFHSVKLTSFVNF
jgi:hypothetical protein